MRKTSVQNFSHLLCIRVATCTCQSFENKNKPVSVPLVVTMCTVGGHLLCFRFGKVLSKLQLESIFQLTIICKNNGYIGRT